VFEAFCPALGFAGGGFTDTDAVMLSITKAPCEDECDDPSCCGDVEVVVHNTNTASTTNTVTSTAYTGGNTISGSGTITTGDATASTTVETILNTNETVVVVGCACGSACACATAEDVAASAGDAPPESEVEGGGADEPAISPADLVNDIQGRLEERLGDLPLPRPPSKEY
jgi:hypothetical protein